MCFVWNPSPTSNSMPKGTIPRDLSLIDGKPVDAIAMNGKIWIYSRQMSYVRIWLHNLPSTELRCPQLHTLISISACGVDETWIFVLNHQKRRLHVVHNLFYYNDL